MLQKRVRASINEKHCDRMKERTNNVLIGRTPKPTLCFYFPNLPKLQPETDLTMTGGLAFIKMLLCSMKQWLLTLSTIPQIYFSKVEFTSALFTQIALTSSLNRSSIDNAKVAFSKNL